MSEDDLLTLVKSGVICVKPDFIAAHLTNSPTPNPEDYCPSEVRTMLQRQDSSFVHWYKTLFEKRFFFNGVMLTKIYHWLNEKILCSFPAEQVFFSMNDKHVCFKVVKNFIFHLHVLLFLVILQLRFSFHLQFVWKKEIVFQ